MSNLKQVQFCSISTQVLNSILDSASIGISSSFIMEDQELWHGR